MVIILDMASAEDGGSVMFACINERGCVAALLTRPGNANAERLDTV